MLRAAVTAETHSIDCVFEKEKKRKRKRKTWLGVAPRMAAVEARLVSDDWTGNVRELRNYATRVVLGLGGGDATAADQLPLSERVDRFEAATIRATLERVRGDVGAAAAELQLPRRSLYDRMQRHGIEPAAFRPAANKHE